MAGRRVSVSGMLKFLGVSRSGYLAWLHHVPSDTEKRRKAVKAKIQDIYDDSRHINVNIKMYIFDHLRMYIFAILPLDRYIFLSDKIFP